jgi:hypothetical protein
VLLCLALGGCDSSPPGATTSSAPGGGDSGPVTISGCPATPSAPVAPGGYYVNGNTLCTADGRHHLLHGVDRPSLEWSAYGEHLVPEDFQLMASWNANVVRMALNQDYWLADSSLYAANYASTVDQVVAWAEAAGLDVILDLHWSDRGTVGSCATACQQLMADPNSVRFWSDVATRYVQPLGRAVQPHRRVQRALRHPSLQQRSGAAARELGKLLGLSGQDPRGHRDRVW